VPLTGTYVVLAWNDLGMHCLNPSYDTAVILPPYNTVWAQVIQRGNPPQIVTGNITVNYEILNNTKSSNKRLFGQFWTYCKQLFGITLVPDTGLNLEDPNIHNGLSGTMVLKGDHFQVNGIPVTPIDDSNTWNPYQVARITVKDSTGAVLATTQATVPTSDEFSCNLCHGTNPFQNILDVHNKNVKSVVLTPPVLCAACHGSPALGQTGRGSSGKYLSEAIHGFHTGKTAPGGAAIGCYDCHPGPTTQCNRSIAHSDATKVPGTCTNINCHGDIAKIASDIATNVKIPWVNEPKCVSCHSGVNGVDTGSTLFRNAKGHGGLYCAGCHGSPHAMYPVNTTMDKTGNFQATQYQSVAKSLGSCIASCHQHSTSRGGGSSDFAKQHGNGSSKCGTCHTGFVNPATANWPHAYTWKARP
jgi:predicted CxxxxCH...CXXCH cytochrome family protein